MSAPTLVDCGCEARVHADGSGIEIDYCPLHEVAPDLLAALKTMVSHGERCNWFADHGDYEVVDAARVAIDKAEGRS